MLHRRGGSMVIPALLASPGLVMGAPTESWETVLVSCGLPTLTCHLRIADCQSGQRRHLQTQGVASQRPHWARKCCLKVGAVPGDDSPRFRCLGTQINTELPILHSCCHFCLFIFLFFFSSPGSYMKSSSAASDSISFFHASSWK